MCIIFQTAPKCEIDLDSVNVVFAKDKIGVSANGLQITYFFNGKTRSLFVYSDDSKVILQILLLLNHDLYLRLRSLSSSMQIIVLSQNVNFIFFIR